jgi:hypothetical protein
MFRAFLLKYSTIYQQVGYKIAYLSNSPPPAILPLVSMLQKLINNIRLLLPQIPRSESACN